MLAHRIAVLAVRMGIPLPTVIGNARLGLAGSIRVSDPVPLLVTSQAHMLLADVDRALDGNKLITRLNTSIVWVGCEASEQDVARVSEGGVLNKEFMLVFAAPRLTLRCAVDKGGLRIASVLRTGRRPPGSKMFAGRFVLGPELKFDARDLCELVASQRRIAPHVNRAALDREEVEEREFISGARRYLEALRDHAEASRPVARYQLEGHDPICLRIDGDDEWPVAFRRPGARVEIPAITGKTKSYFIADLSDDNSLLTLDGTAKPGELAPSDELRLHPNDQSLRRMREALDTIAMGLHPAHTRLLEALTRPEALDELSLPPYAATNPETERQERAVMMAVETPDIALIHGPPGTGKTTVISRVVEELVRSGHKVLLVAPTHVALDNVLERVGDRENVTAVRLGADDNVDMSVRRFLVRERRHDLSQQLQSQLAKALARNAEGPVADVQREWAKRIANDDEIGALLLLQANLVCATPIGIAMAREFRDVDVAFDVMIMDEASKATITDFLVPAARAKKWILVGDAKQLPPYVDVGDLEAVVSRRVARTDLETTLDGWTRSLALLLRRHFDERMHPSDERRAQTWRSFVAALAFDASEESREQLIALGPIASMWRGARVTGVPESIVRLGAELLEVQSLALPSVFEHLSRLPESRSVRLNYQHRMAPVLAEFSSELVYGGDYPSAADTRGLGLEIPSLESASIWLDTAYERPERRFEYPRDEEWSGGNYFNDLELDVALKVISECATWATHSWHGDPRPHGRGANATFEIGVICFYRRQAHRIQDEVADRLGPAADPWRRKWKKPAANGAAIDIHVSIVDRFQGREKDLVILCTTRSNPRRKRGHVDNLNRLNVAVTRARHKRIIIGDSSTLADSKLPANDLLRRLHETSERKVKWHRVLGGAK